MLECVSPSQSIASILKKYDGNILKYFKQECPGEGDYQIAQNVLDNFVKSCGKLFNIFLFLKCLIIITLFFSLLLMKKINLFY